ncbi:DUF6461 domain-containing protein [Nocardia aurantia]|uniref:Uncharacterized protein n=1 Tax=Nocardia aurantia TaxID=2585199 RepID=A0A7K0DZU5_9NOCA|nr:DUF6461 domain-containing protein [Nocardia aurantia]MQY31350.1 hypothetical protein [Nocardia aurantia]
MPRLLRQFAVLGEPVESESGEWALRYDEDGRAVIAHRNGEITWAAGEVGSLRLELDGVFAVYDGPAVVWRGDAPVRSYSALHVTDEGDGVLLDDGLPVYSLRTGPIEAVSLGDRAPVAEIIGNRILKSANGKRTVVRQDEHAGLVHKRRFTGGGMITVVQPDEARTLQQPDTWLTWRFLDSDGSGAWELVLVDAAGEVRWIHGRGRFDPTGAHPADPTADHRAADDANFVAWLESGLDIEAYCVTVIHDVDPDEALRRFGATDAEISTATWPELLRRARYEEADWHQVVAAFALGPHTLLVEDNGWEGSNRPDLSRGTFAVSSYCSINADSVFLVSRDGDTLATFQENCPGDAEGSDIDVLTKALAEMGIDDPRAFDEDDENFLEDLELLCRVAEVRPTIADVTAPARVAILPR